MGNFTYVVCPPETGINVVCNALSQHPNIQYIGSLLRAGKSEDPKVEPARKEILREVYGRPEFNLGKIDMRSSDIIALEDYIDEYVDAMMKKFSEQGITYVTRIPFGECPCYYKVWDYIFSRTESFIYMTRENWLDSYVVKQGKQSPFTVNPVDVLDFFTFMTRYTSYFDIRFVRAIKPVLHIDMDNIDEETLVTVQKFLNIEVHNIRIAKKPVVNCTAMIKNYGETALYFRGTPYEKFFS